MTITALPTAPSRSDTSAVFVAAADAFVAALPTFVTEANALAAAMNLNSTTDTSASSVAIGTGSKSFTVSAGKSFVGGMWLTIADAAAPSTNSMVGQVTSYSGTSLVMNITSVLGSGTKTSWLIAQSAPGGATLENIQAQSATAFTTGGSATAFTLTPAPAITANTSGQRFRVNFHAAAGAAPTLAVSGMTAKNLKYRDAAGAKQTVTAVQAPSGWIADVEYDGTDWVVLNVPTPITDAIRSISASVAANAMTISASALSLDFRSATLGSGTVTTVSGAPSNLVISSGSTLGTTSGAPSRIAVLALNNAGTIELAAVNLAGGVNLDETGVISTTAEGGAGAADSATVIYSTTARSNVAYRVLGFIESTQTTAGTWATAPSLIQGDGGKAMSGMLTVGAVTASTSGTSIDYTSIPAGTKRITVSFSAMSTNGTSNLLVQIGDSGGIEATGYLSAGSQISATVTTTAFTTGFGVINSGGATGVLHGTMTLTLTDPAANTWCASGVFMNSDGARTHTTAGSKSTSAVLDRVRITTVGGTDTFDAGAVNITYES